ncbi:insulinase family protein [Sphingomonas sp. SFZ2018-12]|uniref:M16 family metallopeptidase n=1 Tax=Sphingomonas sp. SFZ2018-12 TaxID=2683197 RepID=UPI001F0DF07D|nr:pitrilysin family protein [Sphingomonas sp. SFZ2018-12]MCH4892140.1 insulinase family protein [Sphingomonas sp. SFZ2018-12]
MTRARTLLAGLAATCLVAPAIAQDYPPPPPIAAPKPFKLPATETFRLSNGMQVTLIPFGVTPKTVVSLRIFAGNLNEGEDTWIADITGDLIKEGAGGKSAADLAATAASFGGDLGVGVSQQSTAISMSVLSEHTAHAIQLISDVARRPDFPADAFGRVKANWQRRLALTLSQPQALADAALARSWYGDHPYGRNFPTAARLNGYTLDQAKAFHAANYGARRAHLYIAGRFDAAAAKAAIQQAFGDWAAGPERLSLPPRVNPGPRVLLIDRPNAPQSTLRVAFPAPVAGSADDIPLRVTNALLGGAFSSRITRNIREEKGYTYSPGSGIAFQPGDAQWTFDADVTTAVTGASLTEVFKEIRTLQTTAPTPEEAAGIATYMAGIFTIQNSTAPAVVGTLANRDTLGLPANWLENYVPAVLAVKGPAMTAAAKKAFPLDKMTLVVVGDLKTVEPQVKALPELKGYSFETVTVP